MKLFDVVGLIAHNGEVHFKASLETQGSMCESLRSVKEALQTLASGLLEGQVSRFFLFPEMALLHEWALDFMKFQGQLTVNHADDLAAIEKALNPIVAHVGSLLDQDHREDLERVRQVFTRLVLMQAIIGDLESGLVQGVDDQCCVGGIRI